MRYFANILLALASHTALAEAVPTPGLTFPPLDPFTHANDIFNAIHSSMRQFGSSLNHNGLGFYIASVPRGIEFYHGTSHQYRINGTEWLAFEPEHALLFASMGIGGGPHGPGRPGRGPPPLVGRQHEQIPLGVGPPSGDHGREGHGYLHTYKTSRPLRLLYLDGQSAAKSDFGTLDTQDLVIRKGSAVDPMPGGGESERAQDLCRVAQEDWAGAIDGVLRMEGGFEIILCSFAQTLDVVDIKEVSAPSTFDRYAYYEAVASRYDGIGQGRVSLDYDNFISMFALSNATYVDDEGRPRMYPDSAQLQVAREMIQTLALSGEIPKGDAINWQGVVDMYVTRWSDRLEYWFTLIDNEKSFQEELTMMLRPYVNTAQRDSEKEIERCLHQYWPETTSSSSASDSVAAQAVHTVVRKLCSSVWAASEAIEFGEAQRAFDIAAELKKYLSWTTWKRCRGCQIHEICKLPIWPMGSKEDFTRPTCTSDFSSGGGYWRSDGPGRHWPPGGHGGHSGSDAFEHPEGGTATQRAQPGVIRLTNRNSVPGKANVAATAPRLFKCPSARGSTGAK